LSGNIKYQKYGTILVKFDGCRSELIPKQASRVLGSTGILIKMPELSLKLFILKITLMMQLPHFLPE
jgi:hypothetical protein